MQLLLDLALPAPPTLDNFEPGGNAEVLAALRAWLDATSPESCVYVWGPPGAGKTHLLRASVAAGAARGHELSYLPATVTQRQPAAATQGQPATATPGQPATATQGQAAIRPEWLAADDVHALDAEGEAALFTLLNRAAAGELRLLLAGDNAPSGLRLRPDVRTRIGAALVLQVKPLTDEDKAQALRRHADARGFELPEEAAQHLLRHGRRDLPSLLALLDAADRYSLQTQRAVSVPLLREVLRLAEDKIGGSVVGGQ